MKRIKKILIATCLCICGILAIPLGLLIIFIIAQVGVQPLNNHIAAGVEQEVKSIPLPQETEFIESISAAGKLVGNGNGMQYFGAMLIKSDLSLEELDAYYSAYREVEWEYVVEVQKDKKIETIDRNYSSDYLCFETDIDDDNYYIVYSWGDSDFDFITWFDIRGH